jgi:hypothetical protein
MKGTIQHHFFFNNKVDYTPLPKIIQKMGIQKDVECTRGYKNLPLSGNKKIHVNADVDY